jgi:hypothetical protein
MERLLRLLRSPKARQLALMEALSKALATGRAADGDAFIQATETQFGIQQDRSILENLRGWGAQFTTELQTLLEETFTGSEADVERAISNLTTAERAGFGPDDVAHIKLVRKLRAALVAVLTLLGTISAFLFLAHQVKDAAIEVKDSAIDLVAGKQADKARATRVAQEVEASGCQWRKLAAPDAAQRSGCFDLFLRTAAYCAEPWKRRADCGSTRLSGDRRCACVLRLLCICTRGCRLGGSNGRRAVMCGFRRTPSRRALWMD